MNFEEKERLDILSRFPPKQEGKTLKNLQIAAFAVSLQGASHRERSNVPCQDYSDIRWMEEAQVLLAGIADGVGSCALSHWGAYFAVRCALDFIEKEIEARCEGGKYELTNIEEIQEILIGAFHAAQDGVEQNADEAQQAVFNFQSTLTVVVYDGLHVYCCHCGDDGVVVQEQGGTVKMITKRIKGDEANSVYPLQSGPSRWQVTGAKNPVSGFVMATDGVLDNFVPVFPDYYGVNYSQGIYYPFMRPAMEHLAGGEGREAAEETLDYYKAFLNSEEYRRIVKDDITLIAVVSPEQMKKSEEPRFNVNIWNTVYEEHRKAVRLRLAGKAVEDGETPLCAFEKQTERETEKQNEELDARQKEPQKKSQKKRFVRRLSKPIWFLGGLMAGILIIGTISFFTGRGVRDQPETEKPVAASALEQRD